MPARIIIVGGGARCHALATRLLASPSVERVVVAPGTSGLERRGIETAPVSNMDFPGLLELAELEEADLTLVVSNTPLVEGLVDAFEARGLPVFGPTRGAAQLEGSKAFARMFMNRLRMPMPRFAVCTNAASALHIARTQRWPRVFKADGLTYARGVRVIDRLDEAEAALDDILDGNAFSLNNERIVIEERLTGPEITVFSLTDGEHIAIIGHVLNYPRLLDGDKGPPTRGMGQVYPSGHLDADGLRQLHDEVLRPTIEAMNARGTPLRGALSVDLMVARGRPVVLDFNVRFGDPVTQTLLTAIDGDLYPVFQACRTPGQLPAALAQLRIDPRPRVAVVLAARGYPDTQTRGDLIHLHEAPFLDDPDLWLFEDGLRFVPAHNDQPERLETTGGRVYTLIAAADTVAAARARVYDAVRHVRFEGMQWRGDIGGPPPP